MIVPLCPSVLLPRQNGCVFSGECSAMPQPESWSSDCRISGFSASSSSCRIETGSAATQPNTRHMARDPTGPPPATRGRILRARRFARHGNEGAGTEQDLVGAAGQVVRARAAGGRGEKPPAGAARGGDRLSQGEGRADVHLDDGLPSQPPRVRGSRPRVAPRARRVGAAERGRAGGAAAAAAPRAAPPGRGGGARRSPYGLRGGG